MSEEKATYTVGEPVASEPKPAPELFYGERVQDEWWVEAHPIYCAPEVTVGLAWGEDLARQFSAAPNLLAALEAICVMPWGWCCCPGRMGNMEGKPLDEHTGECRDARIAIAKARGETL